MSSKTSRSVGLYLLSCLAALLIAVLLRPAWAGVTPQDSEMVRIELGEDRMIPGYEVTVPCFIEMTPQVEVGKIELEVAFPHEKVSFQNVRRGLISDQIEAEIGWEVETAEADGVSVVKLTLRPKEEIPIPPGFLFDLVFSISPEMTMDSPPIVLKNTARAYRLGDPPQPVGNLQTEDGLIRVVSEPPPVASCFFYMH